MRAHASLWLVACLMVVCASCSPGPTIALGHHVRVDTLGPLPRGVDGRVDVNRSTMLAAIPHRFLGLSIEGHALCHILHLDSTRRSSFEAMIRRIGPGTLRIGGRSTDLSAWRPFGHARCSDKHTTFTLAEARSVFAMARRTDFTVMWGLPLIRFDPEADAKQAKQLFAAGKDVLMGWTIGNEPDLYVKSGLRTLPWGYRQYFRQWQLTAAAVSKAVPGIGIVGPETCCNPLDFGSFAVDAEHNVSALSVHFYAGTRSRHPASFLLGRRPDAELKSLASYAWLDASSVDRLPLYMTETNSFPIGGVAGVSNRFAATLWLVEALLRELSLHFSQVDIQQSSAEDPYNPILKGGRTGTPYQGMLFVHRALNDVSAMPNARVTERHGVRMFALTTPAGSRFVVVNPSRHVRTVIIRLDSPARKETGLRMLAPSLRSGPRAIQWRSVAGESLPARSFHLTVPAMCAELMNFTSGDATRG